MILYAHYMIVCYKFMKWKKWKMLKFSFLFDNDDYGFPKAKMSFIKWSPVSFINNKFSDQCEFHNIPKAILLKYSLHTTYKFKKEYIAKFDDLCDRTLKLNCLWHSSLKFQIYFKRFTCILISPKCFIDICLSRVCNIGTSMNYILSYFKFWNQSEFQLIRTSWEFILIIVKTSKLSVSTMPNFSYNWRNANMYGFSVIVMFFKMILSTILKAIS